MKALATQRLLIDNNIDFFNNAEWPGNSPDLNACEHLGAILKDKVETVMIEQFPHNDFTKQDLLNHLENVLEEIKTDYDLFEKLLKSYPARIRAVIDARGYHTDYILIR